MAKIRNEIQEAVKQLKLKLLDSMPLTNLKEI